VWRGRRDGQAGQREREADEQKGTHENMQNAKEDEAALAVFIY